MLLIHQCYLPGEWCVLCTLRSALFSAEARGLFSQALCVIILEQYLSTRSYAQEKRSLHAWYPDDPNINKMTMSRLVDRFRETLVVHDRKWSGRPSVLTDEKIKAVKELLQRSPRKSLRKLTTQAQISYRSAQRSANKLRLLPYCILVVQELRQPDLVKRLQCCRWFWWFVEEHGVGMLDNVFFSDEAWFHLSRYVNSQNSRMSCSENPHMFHEKLLHPQKIGVAYVVM